MDFASGLVNSVRDFPDGQVEYFEEFNLQKNCEILLIKKFWGLVEMTFGQVNASFSLPEWQAVKMTFFAPWHHSRKLKGAVFISFMTFHKKTDIFYFSFSLHQTPFCLSVSLITCSKLSKVKIC